MLELEIPLLMLMLINLWSLSNMDFFWSIFYVLPMFILSIYTPCLCCFITGCGQNFELALDIHASQ